MRMQRETTALKIQYEFFKKVRIHPKVENKKLKYPELALEI